MSDRDRSGARVLDAHVHVFPAEIAARRDEFRARDGWFSLLYENPRSRLATVDDLIDSMDYSGVSQSLLCGFPWRDAGLCDYHNDYMHDAVRRFPGRLSWLGIVSPNHERRMAGATERLLAMGARGIGELNADAQGFDLTAPAAMRPALEICTEWQRPVMLHASEPVGHSYPGKGTATPERMLTLAVRHPQLTIVLAHWGGGMPFFELMPEVRSALQNVYYDSAATTYLYDFAIFRQVIGMAGVEKVLFASDYPVLGQRRLVERVRSLDWLDEAERDAVLHGNAAKIYGIAPNEMEWA